jgi:hypothetical protein
VIVSTHRLPPQNTCDLLLRVAEGSVVIVYDRLKASASWDQGRVSQI